MCTGYAYLIKELCHLANIEAIIIDGYGRTAEDNVKKLKTTNHSWNAVKLNKKWYLCDATWSSRYMVAGNIFVNDYNDGYFLTDPALFGKNHFPTLQKWALDKNLSSTVFVNAPLVYGEAFKHKITPLYPQNMDVSINKNDEIQFSFKTTKNISDKNIALVYYRGTKENLLKISNIKKEDKTISFSYIAHHLGTYDTHLKINDDIVATYILKVTKN